MLLEREGSRLLIVEGALEDVLNLCSAAVHDDGGAKTLDIDSRAELLRQSDNGSSRNGIMQVSFEGPNQPFPVLDE